MEDTAPAEQAGTQSSGQASPAQSSAPKQANGSLIPGPSVSTPAALAAAAAPAEVGAAATIKFERKPDWLKDKFWNPETGEANIENLAKGHAHLEARLGAFSGAPPVGEDGKVHYEIHLPEGVEGLNPEDLATDPLWVGLTELAEKNNVSQEFLDQVAGHYFKTMANENMANREKEMTQLRFSGWSDAKLREFGQWWASQCDTTEEFEDIQAMCRTAQGVLTLERIRNRMLGTRTLPPSTQPSQPTTYDEINSAYVATLGKMASAGPGSAEFKTLERQASELGAKLAAMQGR